MSYAVKIVFNEDGPTIDPAGCFGDYPTGYVTVQGHEVAAGAVGYRSLATSLVPALVPGEELPRSLSANAGAAVDRRAEGTPDTRPGGIDVAAELGEVPSQS